MSWFGFSRRERRSVIILLILIILVVAIPYLVPSENDPPEDLSLMLSSKDISHENDNDTLTGNLAGIHFNPNSASYDSLVLVGFSERQAMTLINYRSKGGRFNKPDDLKKIYGIDEKTFARLKPFISIPLNISGKKEIAERADSNQKKIAKIDLNTADSATLERLPGIGPVLTSRIIKYRRLLGGFTSSEQLKEVYGLREGVFNIISDKVFADSSHVKQININISGEKELSKHPYLNDYEVKSILKFRETNGLITGITQLVDNKIILPARAKKISPYLKY